MRGGSNKYPPEISDFIRSNYKGRLTSELVEMLNAKFDRKFTVTQIQNWKKNHQLASGVKTTFKKGIKPQNAIQKGQHLSPQTQFKKGDKPLNYKPVGTERIDIKDGYVLVKVADPNVWKAKHRMIWEEAYGPIPPKHRLIFLDGNRLNISLDNLRLTSYGVSLMMNKKKLFYEDPSLTEIGLRIAEMDIKIHERKAGLKHDQQSIPSRKSNKRSPVF